MPIVTLGTLCLVVAGTYSQCETSRLMQQKRAEQRVLSLGPRENYAPKHEFPSHKMFPPELRKQSREHAVSETEYAEEVH